MNQKKLIPIACELSQAEQERCAEAYRTGLFSHVTQVTTSKGGYELRFAWSSERVRELGDFLALESACCSFLDHSLEIPRGKQDIWLRFTGADAAGALVRDGLAKLLPADVSLPPDPGVGSGV